MIVSSPVTLSGAGTTFTGIPATTSLLFLSLIGVKISAGSSSLRARFGKAAGLVSSGYDSQSQWTLLTQGYITSTTDFCMQYSSHVQGGHSGNIVFACVDPKAFLWTAFGNWSCRQSTYNCAMTGRLALGGPLTQLNVFPAGGTFTGGTANYVAAG